MSSARASTNLHRPFFLGGIGVVLTLGSVWGAAILVRMAMAGSFTSVGLHEVNAHGHAQIFGWLGLFVMGFAYEVFPRFHHTTLAHPRLARATFGLMLGGLVLRSALQALFPVLPAVAPLAVFGALCEIIAVTLFVYIIARTILGAPRPLPYYDAFIFAALFWFLVQTIYAAVYFAATVYAPNRDALLQLAATWQGPLRDLQIHGFAMILILGVSQRILPHHYGTRTGRTGTSLLLLALINLGLVANVTGYLLMRHAGRAWAGLWYSGILLMAGAVFALVLRWRLWSTATEYDRSLKFFRTAYGWLFLSLGMLVLLPVYQFVLLPALAPGNEAARIGFSHAYYGAIRHAITVGFVSLMIVGVATRVVPVLSGRKYSKLPALWAPFVFINLGCAMRVFFQTMTDFEQTAFPFAGVSGVFEVAGLAIWGAHIASLLLQRKTDTAPAGLPDPAGTR